MGRVLVAAAALVAAGQAMAQAPAPGPSAQAAPKYPFVGRWNCEVATFTFSDKVYNNGSENMPIRRIVPAGKNQYRLEFDKGYRIVVQVVNAQKMNWMSEASGDGFTCKRLK